MIVTTQDEEAEKYSTFAVTTSFPSHVKLSAISNTLTVKVGALPFSTPNSSSGLTVMEAGGPGTDKAAMNKFVLFIIYNLHCSLHHNNFYNITY